MGLPTNRAIVTALRGRFDIAAGAIGGFPDAAHRALWNGKSYQPRQGESWAAESFSRAPNELRGPRDGGGVTLSGIYTWTLSAGAGDGDTVFDSLDAIVAQYFTSESYVVIGGGIVVRVRSSGAYLDGPRNVGGWAVTAAVIPWYVLANNSVIP